MRHEWGHFRTICFRCDNHRKQHGHVSGNTSILRAANVPMSRLHQETLEGKKKTINIGNKSPRTGPASFQSTWWFLLFLFVTEFSSNLIFLGGEWGDLRVCRVYSSADPSLTSSRFRDSKKASAPLGTFSSLNESKCNNRVDFWTGKVKFQLNCNSSWTLFNVT